jgi:beta-carotene hydroxylase
MDRTLPRQSELPSHLFETNTWQRVQPLFAPYFWAGCFMIAWHVGLFWISLVALVGVFSACSTSTHDVVHGSLGLKRRSTEVALCLLGLPILESGHAYRATHLYHHRHFPSEDDIEGVAAEWPLWRVLLSGPLFLPNLWFAAWRRQPCDRYWLILEACFVPLSLLTSAFALRWSQAPLVYTLAVWASSWLYPVFAVWLPHRGFGNTPVQQARTFRGRVLPRIFRPLAYHLEHHLYPGVPSHNLPALAAVLEPELRARGVQPIHVP